MLVPALVSKPNYYKCQCSIYTGIFVVGNILSFSLFLKNEKNKLTVNWGYFMT